MTQQQEIIIILDFGSQYTQLIARRLRESRVYCEIHPFNTPAGQIRALYPSGLILSGGPSSVYEVGAPMSDLELTDIGVPILGICYGMHALGKILGGRVEKTALRWLATASVRI